MAKRKKSITDLILEEQRLKEQLALKRQKLNALRKKVREEYRKREASFLIGVGRTLLKYGKPIRGENGEILIAIPLNFEGFRKAFTDYSDIVELNDDFKKWLRYFD